MSACRVPLQRVLDLLVGHGARWLEAEPKKVHGFQPRQRQLDVIIALPVPPRVQRSLGEERHVELRKNQGCESVSQDSRLYHVGKSRSPKLTALSVHGRKTRLLSSGK
jgi:hypothetical protein